MPNACTSALRMTTCSNCHFQSVTVVTELAPKGLGRLHCSQLPRKYVELPSLDQTNYVDSASLQQHLSIRYCVRIVPLRLYLHVHVKTETWLAQNLRLTTSKRPLDVHSFEPTHW